MYCRKCRKCGAKLNGTERFCTHCGAKIDYFNEGLNAEDIVQGIQNTNSEVNQMAVKSAQTGASRIIKCIVAGVLAVSIVGAGACVGYLKHTAKSADTKQDQVMERKTTEKEKTVEEAKESIPEFTLSEEQQEKIQYAAGMFLRAAREEEGFTQDDDFNLQIKKGKVSDSILSKVATAIAYEDDSVMSEGEDPSEIDKDDPLSRKFLRIEDCQKFLKDTFQKD
ncbi:MAG: zinc ribbon domain-containing protein [Lachnospiraceae bacterium]|nr:zinc ribbon domain-containing protein [Lachnospiraceae bacterium]